MAKKRRYMDGGNADPEGTADAGRADGTPGIEGQGGFGGPAGPGDPAPQEFDLSQISQQGLKDLQAQRAKDISSTLNGLGLLGVVGRMTGANDKIGNFIAERQFSGVGNGGSSLGADHNQHEAPGGADPMNVGIAQTTPAAGAAGTGQRQYVWDPVRREYVLVNVGAGANPMAYTQGQRFQMGDMPAPYLQQTPPRAYAMASGGFTGGGIAGALQSRYVKGSGDGQSDDIPVQMDDGGEGRLANNEFVIDATTVAALGNGSSDAGAKRLYEMVKRIRETAHGRNALQRPVDPNKVMPA